jgi:hypothetical protein
MSAPFINANHPNRRLCRSCGQPALIDSAGLCCRCGRSVVYEQLALPAFDAAEVRTAHP